MSPQLLAELEERRGFLEHRGQFPPEELARYAGRWVAWSPDGTRIVAHSVEPEALDDLIRACGEDPERCVVEGIPGEDAAISSSAPGRGEH